MSQPLMILPCGDFEKIRVVRIPEDLESHEAYRFATGIIAEAEERNTAYVWEDISEALEERGFETVETLLGPALD
jgi:hypothetical protein